MVSLSRLSEMFGVAPSMFKLLPFRFHADYDNQTSYTPQMSTPMICSGRFTSFTMLIVGAKRILKACTAGLSIQLLSAVLGVVLAAEGYPASPRKGDEISGLDEKTPEGTKIFEAGTKSVDGKVVTSGGRVLCVTALGEDIKDARDRAYKLIEKVHFNGMFYRNDIAWRALKRD